MRCAERFGATRTKPWPCNPALVQVSPKRNPLLGLQYLVEVLRRKIPIPRPVLFDDKLDLVRRRSPSRCSATTPIDQSLRPLRLVAVAKLPEMSLADPQ